MSTWLLPILLAVLGATAWRYGVDSRDGCDWKPYSDRPVKELYIRSNTPTRDLARLARAIARLNAGQVGAWERYLRRLRPWEADWLHWTRDSAGDWRLEGHVLPPLPRQPS